jgi:hypothetical protein
MDMDVASAASAAFYTRPKFLLGVFAFANLLLFVDRGIIPGATVRVPHDQQTDHTAYSIPS